MGEGESPTRNQDMGMAVMCGTIRTLNESELNFSQMNTTGLYCQGIRSERKS